MAEAVYRFIDVVVAGRARLAMRLCQHCILRTLGPRLRPKAGLLSPIA